MNIDYKKFTFALEKTKNGHSIVLTSGWSISTQQEITEYTSTAKTTYLAIIEVCQKLQQEYEATQQQERDKHRIAQAFIDKGLPVPEAYK